MAFIDFSVFSSGAHFVFGGAVVQEEMSFKEKVTGPPMQDGHQVKN